MKEEFLLRISRLATVAMVKMAKATGYSRGLQDSALTTWFAKVP